MASYNYQGYDLDGREQRGTVDAEDELSARARVESRQIRVTRLEENKGQRLASDFVRSLYTVTQVIYTLLTPTCMVCGLVAWNWPVNLLHGEWYLVFAPAAAAISLFIIGLLMTSKGQNWSSGIGMSIVIFAVVSAGLTCMLHVANWYLDSGTPFNAQARVISTGPAGVVVKLSNDVHETWKLDPPPPKGSRLLLKVRPGFLGKPWVEKWLVAPQG